MRISDWSSDVCSSDLVRRQGVSGLFAPGVPVAAGLTASIRIKSGLAYHSYFYFRSFTMSDIKHVNPGTRMSDAVIHNGVAYFSGQPPGDATQAMEGQPKQVLATIDPLLAKGGSDKSR